MSKLNNHIYLTICEISLQNFKKSKFLTFTNYAKDLGISMTNDSLSKSQKNDLMKVSDVLVKIYALDTESIWKYMSDFFNSDKVRQFEISVVLTQEAFPFLV